MTIFTLPVGQMQTNCYLVVDQRSKQTLIIDPGDDGDFIIRKIQDEQAKPVLIIATHGHFDHIMAATELKLAFNIPFLIKKNGQPILDRHQSTAKYFLGIDVDPAPTVDRYIKEGDELRFGSQKLSVIETPGHTPGSICLFWKSPKPILFSGDTIFANGGVGRTDLHGGSQQQLFESIKSKLFTLPTDTIVYPGHGETTTIRKEKQYFS